MLLKLKLGRIYLISMDNLVDSLNQFDFVNSFLGILQESHRQESFCSNQRYTHPILHIKLK